jgi:hypothetical protein
MSTQQKVELARTLCACGSPITTSQLAPVLGLACRSLSVQLKRPNQDKALALRSEQAHEKDDTMGHRTLAALLHRGKNRVMHKYGMAARGKRKKVCLSWQSLSDRPQEAARSRDGFEQHRSGVF